MKAMSWSRVILLGIEVEQLWRDGSEPQPLLDDGDADEKAARDVLLALALLAQRLKGPELIERMQGLGYASSVLLARRR